MGFTSEPIGVLPESVAYREEQQRTHMHTRAHTQRQLSVLFFFSVKPLSFSTSFCFQKTGTGPPPQSIESSFSWFLYFHKSGIISSHQIIFFSARFSTLSILVSVILRHRIISVLTCFPAFANLVQFRIFSAALPRDFWYKASAQSGISFRFTSGFLRSLGWKSSLVYIISRNSRSHTS